MFKSRFHKRHQPLPTVLSQDEEARLIDSAKNLMHPRDANDSLCDRVRGTELCQLKVADIDSQRMVSCGVLVQFALLWLVGVV